MKTNMKQVVCVVFILTLRSVCTAESDSCEPFELKSTLLNKQLVGHMVTETNGYGLHECVKLCMSLSVCNSTDYFLPNKTCKINDVDSSSVNMSEFRPLNGAIFSDISDWPSMMVASCGTRPCAKHQRCIQVKEHFLCIDINTGCKIPSIAYGEVILSAPDNNKFLDTATVRCWKGYIANQQSVKCQASGKWEKATCVLSTKFTDCQEIKHNNPDSVDGVYDILLWKSKEVLSVYCDMDTEGGGWTVFQRRFNGSTNFYRNYNEYTNGFGSVDGEFWLGLKYIQEIAEQDRTELRVDVSSENGTEAYETFSDFSLKRQEYNLTLGNQRSSLNIVEPRYGMFYNKGLGFSTNDHDVDNNVDTNCALSRQGAWWFRATCSKVHLNGEYRTPGTTDMYSKRGMTHYGFAKYVSLQTSTMMIRRINT